jgi:TolA-binding protein
MNHSKRSSFLLALALGILVADAVVPTFRMGAQGQTTPQAADLLLNNARRAYNEKNYTFAADRFREFLNKFGNHKEANAAHYELALCLIEGPAKDYNGALGQLQPLANNKDLPQHPFVLYYLGLSQRGLGAQALGQARARPQEANQHRNAARQRFEEAGKHFAAAADVFAHRADAAQMREWAARARCEHAEMLLRLHKAKEARTVAETILQDASLRKSPSRSLAQYYRGFACFLLGDNLAAGRSLSLLTPFSDPLYGTHARYLLARVHHAAGERQEAQVHYQGVLDDHQKQKQAAVEALKQPDRFRNDPQEKARLEQLVRGPLPDHVARAAFFLGIMQYEDGKFAEAIAQLNAFRQQAPQSPIAAEAQLRIGFCQVQLKQFAEAQRTLQPLADKEPRLADQALLWIAKAQAGAADPANGAAYEQAIKTALGNFRKAADRADKTRRGEILLEMADTQQLIGQHKEAAAVYNQILNDKLLSSREDEVMQHLAAALHLAGDYDNSDKICLHFYAAQPNSVLLPAVLFRFAENAYFRTLAAGSEATRWVDEAIQRYQAVIEKYPEFERVNLARYGLGMAYYRKGDLDKAKEALEAIPAADRNGELALVSYQLAAILIRQAPAKADDALAAGKLEEQLKIAIELLEGFAGSQPNGPHTADALFKLGHCHQRMAELLAQPPDRAKELAAAFAAYQQIRQRFPSDPAAANALFEREKVRARSNDINGAMNNLRRFLTDPLRKAPVAPMALLHLAALLRRQNNPQEAAKILSACRQQHEQELLKDSARAAWVSLIQYHHGIALSESGQRREAKALFDQVARQATGRPEVAEAAVRSGQCLKEDGQQKILAAKKRLALPNLSGGDRANAQKMLEEGTKDVRDAVQYFVTQAAQLRQKNPASEARARMLYEAAWGSRILADKDARKHYQALLNEYPDLAINADARFELAELLSEGGEYDEAIKLLRDALDKEPPPELTDKIRIRLGDCLLRKGDAKAALAQFQPIAARPKGRVNETLCAQAKYRAGECQLRLNAPAEAIKLLESVLRDHPNSDAAEAARKRLAELKKS